MHRLCSISYVQYEIKKTEHESGALLKIDGAGYAGKGTLPTLTVLTTWLMGQGIV